MLVGFVPSVVRTALLENIVTNVKKKTNLHHHISVILIYPVMKCGDNEQNLKMCLFFSYISACDAGTFGENCAFQCSQNCNGTCGYIDGSCTACKIGWKGYNCSEGNKKDSLISDIQSVIVFF